ncbi:MAG: hydrolase [Bacteroidota bacterium]
MKKRLFMYLFIFTLLLVIFQYVNSKNIIESYDKKLTNYIEKNESLRDSIQMMKDREADNIYAFRFDTNDSAMTYIENDGFRILEFIPFIKDELMALNVYNTEDHPLIPFASMTDNKMAIDQIRLLNHKWIIASFTDGTYWGEMLLKYELEDKKELRFKVLASTIYAN